MQPTVTRHASCVASERFFGAYPKVAVDHEFERAHAGTFFGEAARKRRHRAGTDASNVGVVATTSDVEHGLAVTEHGRDDRDVRKVAAAGARMVGHDDLPIGPALSWLALPLGQRLRRLKLGLGALVRRQVLDLPADGLLHRACHIRSHRVTSRRALACQVRCHTQPSICVASASNAPRCTGR